MDREVQQDMYCKSIVVVPIAVMHYKFISHQVKFPLQISFLVLRKFVMRFTLLRCFCIAYKMGNRVAKLYYEYHVKDDDVEKAFPGNNVRINVMTINGRTNFHQIQYSDDMAFSSVTFSTVTS